MTSNRNRATFILAIAAVLVWLSVFAILQPSIVRHDDALTIIDTRAG